MRRLGVLAAVLTAAGGRADDTEAFRDEYAPHWERLTAYLWRNVKVAGVAEVREPLPYLELFRGRLEFKAVAGEDTLVWLGRFRPSGPPVEVRYPNAPELTDPFDLLVVVRPDGLVRYMSSPPGRGWFRYPQAVRPWQGRFAQQMYATTLTQCQLAWPLSAADIGRGPNAYFDPLRVGDMPVRSAEPRELSHRHVHRKGADTVVVAEDNGKGYDSITWTYLRLPDYLVTERQVQVGVLSRAPKPVAIGGYTVSYAPAPAGELPFPAAVSGWRLWPDGSWKQAEEVTFTEYRRHTPTPAELDVEKRFGVRLPAPVPRPPLPLPGTYLTDPRDLPPQPPQPPPPAPAPPPANKPAGWHRLRLGLLLGLAAAAGLLAVWWRRR